MIKNFHEIINGDIPVLVDFSAEWCGPCKMLAPVLEQLKGKMGEKLRILKVDIDKNGDLSMKYNIKSVPTLMLFHNGNVKWSGVGLMSADQIERAANLNCLETPVH